MRQSTPVLSLLLLTLVAPAALAEAGSPPAGRTDPQTPICLMIESAAQTNRLPVDFFVRLIWRESRFRPDAIGPITRSGQRAQGIAQFMPGTAVERGLLEPFEPSQALPKSGEFLAELRDEFGNLGLAAAAYNAGPQRVRDFIAGTRALPTETRNYVFAITGHPIEDWLDQAKGTSGDDAKNEEQSPDHEAMSCREIMSLLKQPPREFVTEFLQRRVPSWCKHLYHPNTNVCGGIHQQGPAINTPTLAKSKGAHKSLSSLHVSTPLALLGGNSLKARAPATSQR